MDDCEEQTAQRTIDAMRDHYYAPIEYDKRTKGWHYDDPDNTYELPGIWFTTKELIGLASLLKIVDDMQSELLNDELSSISVLIDELFKKHHIPSNLFKQHIRLASNKRQNLEPHILQQISVALIKQTRLYLRYQSYEGEQTTREISPIKLIYYQENWYLDAYCHLRKALRSFKVSRVLNAQSTPAKSKQISQADTDAHYQSAYGIFSGQAINNAVLQFYDDVARDVALQEWHPQQQGDWNEHGYLLTVPYNKDTELIQEILKYANDVEVISPAKLRKKIINIASDVTLLYSGKRIKI